MSGGRILPGLVVALASGWLGCSSDAAGPGDGPADGDPEIAVELVVDGLLFPLHLTAPPGDARLFIVEKLGRIRVVEDGALLSTPFLDISARVSEGGERGLLGLAFHPQYAANGRFFVDYTDLDGNTRIERYTVSGDPNRADPASAKPILTVDQPAGNHNGGLLAFGPDGMLYIGMGDGGGAGDQFGNGQNLGTLLGTLLRIDVDGGDPYSIPPDNPFVGRPVARCDFWAYGLRNPWRWTFDRTGGVLYVADVGQAEFEEVNAVPAAAVGRAGRCWGMRNWLVGSRAGTSKAPNAAGTLGASCSFTPSPTRTFLQGRPVS